MDVMSSKWATVLGIPVSLPAVILYLVTLALSLAGTSGRLEMAMRGFSSLILIAAAYFMAIQVFWIGSVCVSCTSIHAFAAFGVILITRGMRSPSFAFRLTGLRKALPVSIAVGIVGGLAITQSLTPDASRATQVRVIAEEGSEFAHNLLFTPFISETGGVSLALDGGALPIFGAEVPEIPLGASTTRLPLQVALLNDWTCPHCLELHAMLHHIYQSPESDSLPPISLRLLPVFFDQKAEAAHNAMLNVHFGTGNPEAFPTLAEEITSGKLSPDPASIRARLMVIDPATASRWETFSDILKPSVSEAFSLADSQMRRNISHLKVSTLPQLTVFDAVLAGLPGERELVAFIQAAATRQQALLDSPHAPATPEMDRTCGCAKSGDLSGHVHSHECAHASDDHTQATLHTPMDGPQIKFDGVSLKTRPIAMGEAAGATFQFTNTGNQTLLIHAIHTGCGCVVAHDWSRTVPPGERGSISFTYDTNGKEAAGLGEHVRHVWVASNSVVRTDPSYGDQLEIKVPVISAPMHPRAPSMTAATP